MLDWKSLSADYARYHTHPMNRLCHVFGIGAIMLCVIRWTQFGGFPVPLAAAALVLYAWWDFELSLIMAAVIIGMSLVAPLMSAPLVWAVFVAGWALQFVGHAVFEKKSPAFAKNAVHFLVGPFWILGELLGEN
jgi:uncharacterized membrane protein YGL010W